MAPPNYSISHSPGQASSQPDSEHGSSVSTPSEAQDAMLHCALQILEQPLTLLRSGVVRDEQMQRESTLIPGSTVGRHLRHVHDHFRLLLDSLATSPSASSGYQPGAPLPLDYDRRSRAPQLERSAGEAIRQLEATQQRLKELFGGDEIVVERRIRLAATTPFVVEFGTTVGREIWFVCLHAIHHLALMRPILSGELGLDVGADFGVAPSTMVHRQWSKAKL